MAVVTACNHYLPIKLQGRSMVKAGGVKRADLHPFTGGRIVQFRTGKSDAFAVVARRDQHLSIAQQRGRMRSACHVQRGGWRPSVCDRIVKIGIRKEPVCGTGMDVASNDKHLSVRQ